MDELSEKPLNKAHVLVRKAVVALDKGSRVSAIELYREANEELRSVFDCVGDNGETIKRSVELQIDEIDWKIRCLQLKDLAEFKKALGGGFETEDEDFGSSTNKRLGNEEDEDDGVVLIHNEQVNFMMESLKYHRLVNLNYTSKPISGKDIISDDAWLPLPVATSSGDAFPTGHMRRSPSLPESSHFYSRRIHKPNEM